MSFRRLFCALAVSLSFPAFAATHTWTGATSTFWSAPANWMEGTTPMGDATAALVFPGNATSSAMNDLSSLTIQSITFTGSPNNIAISGNGITLSGGIVVDASVTSGSPSIDMNIQLGTAQNFTVSSSTAGLFLAGMVTGASTLAYAGSGSFYLYNSGAYGGTTVVTPDTHVYVFSPQALGDTAMQTLVVGTGASGGVIAFNPGASTCAEPLSFTDGATFVGVNGFPSTATYAGPISLSGVDSFDVSAGETWILSSVISGAGQINAGGSSGTLVLTGNNTYTGATTIHGPSPSQPFTLRVNGTQTASPIGVGSGGVLGGTGTVGVVSVYSGGRVSPGASPGILSTGSVTFDHASFFRVELNGSTLGTGFDQLSVLGGVEMADPQGLPTLEVVLGYTPAMGTVFTILQTTAGVVGTFAGLMNGATFCAGGQNFQITYGADAVTLTAMGAETTPPVVTAPANATVTQTLCN